MQALCPLRQEEFAYLFSCEIRVFYNLFVLYVYFKIIPPLSAVSQNYAFNSHGFFQCATGSTYQPRIWSSIVKSRVFAGKKRLEQMPSLPYCYGWRGVHPNLHMLCPYEFCCQYFVESTTLPKSTKASAKFHCHLTAAGNEVPNSSSDLHQGKHYVVSTNSGHINGKEWFAFPEYSGLRHDYVMVKRDHRCPPNFHGAAFPVKCSREEQAHRMSVFFRPWVVPSEHSSQHAPIAAHLCPVGEMWESSFTKFCERVPTLFLKNVITNFQAVFSNIEQEQIGVEDGNQDAPVFAWNESEFKSAKQTRWRTKKVAGEAVVDPVAQR